MGDKIANKKKKAKADARPAPKAAVAATEAKPAAGAKPAGAPRK